MRHDEDDVDDDDDGEVNDDDEVDDWSFAHRHIVVSPFDSNQKTRECLLRAAQYARKSKTICTTERGWILKRQKKRRGLTKKAPNV